MKKKLVYRAKTTVTVKQSFKMWTVVLKAASNPLILMPELQTVQGPVSAVRLYLI